MQVNVTRAMPGSPDGIQLVDYPVGVQEMPDDLAAVFLAEGWAELPAPARVPAAAAAPVAPTRNAASAPKRRKAAPAKSAKKG